MGFLTALRETDPKRDGKMDNIATDYREARARLRLGRYDAWLVETIVNLLKRHDDRVAAEKRLRVGRRTSASMLARQDAGWRVSSPVRTPMVTPDRRCD